MKKGIAVFGLAFMLSAATIMTSFADVETPGWHKLGVNRYYVEEDGTSRKSSQWYEEDGKWYHFEDTGYISLGWFKDTDGRYYYFDRTNGDMLVDTTTPDGYYVGADGVYVPDKAKDKKKMGPAATIDYSNDGKLKYKGMELEVLGTFATPNLTTADWGDETARESFNQINGWINSELLMKGLTSEATTPISITEEGVVYRIGDNEPELKMVKAGDHYEIYDYARIDDACAEAGLMGMCVLISSQPQELFNQIYRALEVDQRNVRDYEYRKFGDFQIMFRMEDKVPVFMIKGK